jgi:sugar lactone lactonase YvrE
MVRGVLAQFVPALIVSVFILASSQRTAWAAAFHFGDVFVGVGDGMIKHFDNNGNFIETLDTTSSGSEDTGMCFDASGNLYATTFQANMMTKFNNTGAIVLHPWGSGFNFHPESCVRDSAGNIYVGQADGTADILKFDQAGNLLSTFDPPTGPRGTDWIDLSADQCTMLYTSESPNVRRFDVCANTQLTDFCDNCGTGLFGLRIAPDGSVFVADLDQNVVHRLDSSGTEIRTYADIGLSSPFALNLDPDSTSFWTAGYNSCDVFKFDIATGNVVTHFNAGLIASSCAGLAVFGEHVQGAETNCTDGIDNDGDQLIDCADPDCALDPACVATTSTTTTTQATTTSTSTTTTSSTTSTTNPSNHDPDCGDAVADRQLLWPPNHKYAKIHVNVDDPDGDPVTVTVNGITQDEPLDSYGDGHTCPDGAGVGTDTALVRAERARSRLNSRDGRVYHVSFTADDGRGGTCTGTAAVCVPPKKKATCVDEGPLFDSTGPCS